MKTKRGVLVLAILATAGCSSGETEHAPTVDECAANGVAYFKEVGSYPTLSSPPNAGRSAEDVALERCRRSVHAFPEQGT
jgi:hypothetical protein